MLEERQEVLMCHILWKITPNSSLKFSTQSNLTQIYLARFTRLPGIKASTNGKRIRADYVSLDADLSVKLAKARAEKTGREVPLKFIEENNREISKLIPKLIEGEVYDELYLWDTNINGTPRLILKQIDGVLTIEDEDLYLRFLSKAN